MVASFGRKDVAQYSKSTLTTNVYLWLTNLLATLVFLRHPRDRRLFVGYEDFVADPERAVGTSSIARACRLGRRTSRRSEPGSPFREID